MKRLLTVAVLALAVTGCGSKNHGTPTPARIHSNNTKSSPDRSRAGTALLRLSDFPTGWAQARAGANDRFATSCKQVQAARRATTARVTEPSFGRGASANVESIVYVFPNAASATKAFVRLAAPDTRSCVAGDIKARAQSAPKVQAGNPTASKLAVRNIRSDGFGFAITLPLSSGKTRAELHQYAYFLRRGRAIAIIGMGQEIQPFDPALQSKLVSAAARHLEAAFAG